MVLQANHTAARLMCKSGGYSGLAVIENKDEDDVIRDVMLRDSAFDEYFWVGGYKNLTHIWSPSGSKINISIKVTEDSIAEAKTKVSYDRIAIQLQKESFEGSSTYRWRLAHSRRKFRFICLRSDSLCLRPYEKPKSREQRDLGGKIKL